MEKDNSIFITIPQVFNKIEKSWRTFIGFTFTGAIVGLLLALSMTKIYKSEAKVVPEESKNNFGAMGSLASLAGISMDLSNNDDAISPKLYPQVVSTQNFILGLFNTPIITNDGKVKTTYANYIQSYQKKSILSGLFNFSKDSLADLKHINPYKLSKRQYGLVKTIGKRIFCSVDDNTNVITISVEDQDPLVSATMTARVMKDMQAYIVKYRTDKARNDLQNTRKQMADAKKDYLDAQRKYASFSDANEDAILQAIQSKRDELENEMQLRYNIYTQMQQQYQLNKAKVQERTPVYTVLQSASVPVRASGIGRVLTAVICTLIFIFIGFIWVFFLKDIYIQTKQFGKEHK